jgi:SAM-dependent methyltransferase
MNGTTQSRSVSVPSTSNAATPWRVPGDGRLEAGGEPFGVDVGSGTAAHRGSKRPVSRNDGHVPRLPRPNPTGSRLGRRLASFHRRRIAIPVGPDSLVLDVGSGDKPHWRADVLLDRYVDAAYGGQRSGRAAARITRPMFDADAAAMPFADRVFDYVICSHVLEHVPDPAAVVAEMTRVGRAGYIEVPEAASAKILDFPSHLWWCRLDTTEHRPTLVFTAKQARDFDPEIADYIQRSGVEQRLAKLLDDDFDFRVVSLPWTGAVDVRIEGSLDPAFVADALAADAHHQVGQSLVTRALTRAMTVPRRGQRRRRPIEFDQIVKPGLRRGIGEVLRREIYRLPATPNSI